MRLCVMAVMIVGPLMLGHAADEVNLVPAPKEVTSHERTVSLSPAETTIVLGSEATATERYAAERLQELVRRRFGVELAVAAEEDAPATDGPVILLGQASTSERVAELCRERGIDLVAESPGQDAYIVEVLDGRDIVLVCGSNDRGVIYGVQTLFRLLREGGEGLELPAALIRDWPSIPWRGRPYTRVSEHLAPGVLDAYLWAGLNFIDVREGAFGYGPDGELDHEQIGRCIEEAHRRGLFVFGTVSCGVNPEQFDGVIRTFEELIGLGVDGLWISFDDPGGGEGTTELARRVIELGREHGITGRKIATTPPSGSYQHIDTDFNREMAQVPGMAEATWFFTRPPKAEDVASARDIGLQSLPAWWHNWPRTDAGFTHGSYGGQSFRPDGLPSYMEVPPLTWGWHSPQYDDLRDAPRNTDTVMMWGGWQPEYTSRVLGIWAWDPEGHDFEATRRAIYETVYGPDNVEPMMQLDDGLHELKEQFQLPDRRPDPANNFPPILKPSSDRSDAQAQIERLQQLAASIADSAPEGSLLSEERLEERFLEPMRAELRAARVLIGLEERPEQGWPEHEAQVLARMRAGDTEGVQELCEAVRPRLQRQAAQVTEALSGLLAMETYQEYWLQRAEGDVEFWRGELQRRQEALQRRIADRETELDLEAMLANIDSPLQEGEVIDVVTPEQLAGSLVTHRGAWLTGLYPPDQPRAFVMSFPGHTASTPGDFCRVEFSLDCADAQGELRLQLHLTDEYDSDRWTGYRFYQLLHEGEVIWEEDIALTRRGGNEWSSIDVTELAEGVEELDLTLQLLDRRPVGNYTTTIFVGPVRLVAGG
ncbi:MAG: glycoside hydrolase family 20 zincin-like fold domain-containing protein [Armatimonadota bacterium]|nr:glycoside hydrolase family 20 zincin-like fold domain-containing protein [Armatimonadota bacterium]